MFRFTSFFTLRRRFAKFVLKFMGWRFRGQDPPSRWKHIIFISPATGSLLIKQQQWMPYLTSTNSKWIDLRNSSEIKAVLDKKHTALIRWEEDVDVEALTELLSNARQNKVRVSACAWDTTHKAVKFHSQFRPSPYSDRDIRYLSRFFKYFKQI
ncbi:MAG TPA: hypothetical protein EYO58_09545 [Flavobacteriales bacterium]|nr:hypothetical protein [Flavobacteriales bacterium]